MKKISLLIILALSMTVFICVCSQVNAQSSEKLHISLPTIAEYSSSVSGRIIDPEQRDYGVVFEGKVIETDTDGKFAIPPANDQTRIGANCWLFDVVTEDEVLSIDHHIALTPEIETTNPEIYTTPEILTNTIKVEGVSLDEISELQLIDDKGNRFDIEDYYGSSLQLIAHISEELPPGSYKIIFKDYNDQSYESETTMVRPAIYDLKGSRIKKVGHKGKVTFKTDEDTYVDIRGDGHVELLENYIFSNANKKNQVDWIAKKEGTYKIDLTPTSYEEIQRRYDVNEYVPPYNIEQKEGKQGQVLVLTDKNLDYVEDAELQLTGMSGDEIKYISVTTNKFGQLGFNGTTDINRWGLTDLQLYKLPTPEGCLSPMVYLSDPWHIYKKYNFEIVHKDEDGLESELWFYESEEDLKNEICDWIDSVIDELKDYKAKLEAGPKPLPERIKNQISVVDRAIENLPACCKGGKTPDFILNLVDLYLRPITINAAGAALFNSGYELLTSALSAITNPPEDLEDWLDPLKKYCDFLREMAYYSEDREWKKKVNDFCDAVDKAKKISELKDDIEEFKKILDKE